MSANDRPDYESDPTLLAQNDMLSALIDAAPETEPEAVVSSVALRVLVINFTAIHTSAMVRLRSDLPCSLV